jgi:hypothetical protein
MLRLNNLRQRFTRNHKGMPSSNGISGVTREQMPDPVSGNGFTPVNLDLWPDPGHSNYANDVAVVGIGSVTNLLPQFFLGVTGRQVASTALNQVSGAATTHKDLEWLPFFQSQGSQPGATLVASQLSTNQRP